MGNYSSTTTPNSERKANVNNWAIEISMQKGTTTIVYTIQLDGKNLVKTVKGPSGSAIVFSVDPKTFEMMHGSDPSGTDGEEADLRMAIQNMAIDLKNIFQVSEQEGTPVAEVAEKEDEVVSSEQQ